MHSEPWQVFAENGEPIAGCAYPKAEFPQDAVMGAAHVWLWRRCANGVEIMLQKRASTLQLWPGVYDISAAGHIDAGESPLQTAIREAAEEVGAVVDKDSLQFIFASRTSLAKREIDYVYLYEVDERFVPKFDDGEVELVEWLVLSDFAMRTDSPQSFNLLDQGIHYFGLLLDQLRRL